MDVCVCTEESLKYNMCVGNFLKLLLKKVSKNVVRNSRVDYIVGHF